MLVGVFCAGMEVDHHFVKDRAFWRGVNEIIGVLLCDTQVIMMKELPRQFLPVFTQPVDDIPQMPLNAVTASCVFEFDYCHGVSDAAFSMSVMLLL